MTKEELQALGLTEEQITKVWEDYGKNYVAKSQFNAKLEEIKTLKEGQTETEKQLTELKKNNKDNAELVDQLDKLKTDSKTREEEFNTKVKQMQIDSAVDKALLEAKAKNTKAAKSLLDLSKAELEGETVRGLAEQIKKLKETDTYLFGEVNVDGTKPAASGDNQTQNVTLEQQINDAILGGF